MKCPSGKYGLRRAISAATNQSDPSTHADAIEQLKSKHRHSIDLFREGPSLVNCFMCAFGFGFPGSAVDVGYYANNPDISLGKKTLNDFVSRLLDDSDLQEVDLQSAQPKDVVIYLDEGTPVHAASVVSTSRMISKWGSGSVWVHDLWEVPDTYGDEARVFAHIPGEEIEDLFYQFVSSLPSIEHWVVECLRDEISRARQQKQPSV